MNFFYKKFLLLLQKIDNQRSSLVKDTLPKFANNPKNLSFSLPRKIIHPEKITIGDNVILGPNCELFIKTKFHEPNAPQKNQRERKQQFEPSINIGSRVRCGGGGLRITAMDKIVIEDDVILGANVYICDGSHGTGTAEEPYRYQLMDNIKPVIIKSGSWIGRNVVIMPGVTIGENTVVGANSVVTKSIGSQCIAAGIPARIIKQWDGETKSWVKVDKK